MEIFDQDRPRNCSPKTSAVVVFLAAFAIITSWLCVYAVSNALIAVDIMSPWPAEADPRPRWMLNGFFGTFGVFSLLAVLFRWSSRRQLRQIDAMAEAD